MSFARALLSTFCSLFIALILASCQSAGEAPIDRRALVARCNPHVEQIDSLASLTIGNGRFAFTADATGLQTFTAYHKTGLPLGTFSQWGWHSFPNDEGYTLDEILEDHPLPGHPHGLYAVQWSKGPERKAKAADYFRANPHRMHLGNVGFADIEPTDVDSIRQALDMWTGELHSLFRWQGRPVSVCTSCHGERDIISARIESAARPAVCLRFPYPTGQHWDDASDWNADQRHHTDIIEQSAQRAVLRRTVDASTYFVELTWEGDATLTQPDAHRLVLTPDADVLTLNVGFYDDEPAIPQPDYNACLAASHDAWEDYWTTTAVVDFSQCTDPRAPLLERRVVQSQFIMRSQEAQDCPPAETGLMFNTWYGRPHLEMVMWHSLHYGLWNQTDLLERQLRWYLTAMPKAKEIAKRQGFDGLRWMKMTDPWANETPSDVGSYLIWQEPHPLFMAELIYRARPSQDFLETYAPMVSEIAAFMASFLSYDPEHDRYFIEGACGASEAFEEESTINPSFELSYWHFGLSLAQLWRERLGQPRDPHYDDILAKLSPLAMSPDGIYMPAEKSHVLPDFEHNLPAGHIDEAPAGGYVNGQRPKAEARPTQPSANNDGPDPMYITATSPENLLALGMMPSSRLIDIDHMQATLDRCVENFNWDHNTWSWQFPSLAMNATRLLRPDIAIRAITMDGHSELLLPSGNNYRSDRLRAYTPGNGGLLMAIALMCAGWDGCTTPNPGFPNDGTWDVRWEGLRPMP